jgi:hypothetical protein
VHTQLLYWLEFPLKWVAFEIDLSKTVVHTVTQPLCCRIFLDITNNALFILDPWHSALYYRPSSSQVYFVSNAKGR